MEWNVRKKGRKLNECRQKKGWRDKSDNVEDKHLIIESKRHRNKNAW